MTHVCGVREKLALEPGSGKTLSAIVLSLTGRSDAPQGSTRFPEASLDDYSDRDGGPLARFKRVIRPATTSGNEQSAPQPLMTRSSFEEKLRRQ